MILTISYFNSTHQNTHQHSLYHMNTTCSNCVYIYIYITGVPCHQLNKHFVIPSPKMSSEVVYFSLSNLYFFQNDNHNPDSINYQTYGKQHTNSVVKHNESEPKTDLAVSSSNTLVYKCIPIKMYQKLIAALILCD